MEKRILLSKEENKLLLEAIHRKAYVLTDSQLNIFDPTGATKNFAFKKDYKWDEPNAINLKKLIVNDLQVKEDWNIHFSHTGMKLTDISLKTLYQNRDKEDKKVKYGSYNVFIFFSFIGEEESLNIISRELYYQIFTYKTPNEEFEAINKYTNYSYFQAWYFSIIRNKLDYFDVWINFKSHKVIAKGWHNSEERREIEPELVGEFDYNSITQQLIIKLVNPFNKLQYHIIIKNEKPKEAKLMRFIFLAVNHSFKPIAVEGVFLKMQKEDDKELLPILEEEKVKHIKRVLTLKRSYIILTENNIDELDIHKFRVRGKNIKQIHALVKNIDKPSSNFRILGIESNGTIFQSKLVIDNDSFTGNLYTAIGNTYPEQRVIIDITDKINNRLIINSIPLHEWGTICNWILAPSSEDFYTEGVFTHVGKGGNNSSILNGFMVLWEDDSDFQPKTYSRNEDIKTVLKEEKLQEPFDILKEMVRKAQKGYNKIFLDEEKG